MALCVQTDKVFRVKVCDAFCMFLGALIILIAFSTSYWLECTLEDDDKRLFENLGLWEACFNGIDDTNHLYPRRFYGCRWVYDEEFHMLYPILLPPFFVAVQVLFTICFTLVLVGIILYLMLVSCFQHDERQVRILWLMFYILLSAGIFGVIAVILFGVRGDGRDWMPHWRDNRPSWSFALAIVGVFLEIVSAFLFFTQARVLGRHSTSSNAGIYSIEQQKA